MASYKRKQLTEHQVRKKLAIYFPLKMKEFAWLIKWMHRIDK